MRAFFGVILMIGIIQMAVEGRKVKVHGSIRQLFIPPVCTCGNGENSIVMDIPDKTDCVPHVVKTLDCDVMSYQLVAWACWDEDTQSGDIAVEFTGMPDHDVPEPLRMDYYVSAECRFKANSGMCVMEGIVRVEDFIED